MLQQTEEIGSGEEVFLGELMFREWGRRFNRLGLYSKSIQYHKRSIDTNDDEYLLENLLGLSDSLKKAGKFKEADEMAQRCLKMSELTIVIH